MTLTKDRAAELREAHPKWAIWQSAVGRWWATREGAISSAQRDLGVTASLDADTLFDLAGQLAAQEQLRLEA